MRRALILTGLVVGAALLLAAAGSPRGIKEGGTFHIAALAGFFNTIDPALTVSFVEPPLLQPACGALMGYPSKPPPEGLTLGLDLAEADPVVSKDGRTYTFTVRRDARFSSGAAVTPRAFAHALTRLLDPAMKSPLGESLKVLIEKVTVRGRALTIRLKRREPELSETMRLVCAVPPNLPADPEGARAPLPSAGPYYVAEYVPGRRLVLERNRFYKGTRPQHVTRFVADLGAVEGSIVDDITSGKIDYGFVTAQVWSARGAELARRFGVNKGQFFVGRGDFLRMFVLNTSRPLFRKNPKLRQAVNFAVDRRALTRELGPYGGATTDQYLRLKDERIYPLNGPDLKNARELAKGRTRAGKAVLYTRSSPVDLAQARILQQNLKAIGIEVEIVDFPAPLLFEKLSTARDEFDIGRVAHGGPSPSLLKIFDGRTIGQRDNLNWSYFDSPKYNRLFDEADRLPRAERYRAYAELDVQISRDAAPGIPYAFLSAIEGVRANRLRRDEPMARPERGVPQVTRALAATPWLPARSTVSHQLRRKSP
jgi:ABC-type transport system substrate-binding protein